MAAPFAAYYAATLGPAALMAGSSVYNAIEQADISASVQEDDKAKVAGLRRIAIVAVSENTSYAYVPWFGSGVPGGSAVSDGLINGITTSLKSAEVDVIDMLEIERRLSQKGAAPTAVNGQEVYRRADIVDAAFATGADGVLLLSAVSGSDVRAGGFYAWGASVRTDVTIKTVSGRLLSRSGELLMTVNVSYKNGQPPQEAGTAFGLVTAAKIKNPNADPRQAAGGRNAV